MDQLPPSAPLLLVKLEELGPPVGACDGGVLFLIPRGSGLATDAATVRRIQHLQRTQLGWPFPLVADAAWCTHFVRAVRFHLCPPLPVPLATSLVLTPLAQPPRLVGAALPCAARPVPVAAQNSRKRGARRRRVWDLRTASQFAAHRVSPLALGASAPQSQSTPATGRSIFSDFRTG
jgi:hypothetical protein